MIEKVSYYLDFFITLCGFDGNDSTGYFAWLIVILATIVVIYAFYEGISKMLWPGETDQRHIKYQIFDEHALDHKLSQTKLLEKSLTEESHNVY